MANAVMVITKITRISISIITRIVLKTTKKIVPMKTIIGKENQ